MSEMRTWNAFKFRVARIESSRDAYAGALLNPLAYCNRRLFLASIYPSAEFPAIEVFFDKTSTTRISQWGSETPHCEFELDVIPFFPQLRNWNRRAQGRNNKFSKGVSHTATHGCRHPVRRAVPGKVMGP